MFNYLSLARCDESGSSDPETETHRIACFRHTACVAQLALPVPPFCAQYFKLKPTKLNVYATVIITTADSSHSSVF